MNPAGNSWPAVWRVLWPKVVYGVIGCAGEVIARYVRCYEREDMVFNLLYYLPLLERKLGALDQAAPLAGWEVPEAFHTLRRLLEARAGRAGRREYVQVLRLLETFDLRKCTGR